MFASVLIQSVYIAKFFYWETGYFCTMDIQHDRAGFMLCWGCMVWVPSVYTMHTYFLASHPVDLSFLETVVVCMLGVMCVYWNYDCDQQRQEFRRTSGATAIWGKKPSFVTAKYVTSDNEERVSLLLTSGWWGVARHFHYIPEIMAAFFWCVPTVFSLLLHPDRAPFYPIHFFYVVFLTILLTDRAWRDDSRCGEKYKESWKLYCTKVPYKIIPGLV